MSLMDRLRDMFAPIVPDERALTFAKVWGSGQDTAWWRSLSTADQPVTAETIMQSAVGAALRLLASDISALPLDAFERRGADRSPIALPPWLESPTGQPWDTYTDLIADSVMSLHDGNIFYHCLPNTRNIQYIEVLDPVATTIDQTADGTRIYRNYEVAGEPVGTDRIVHVPWLRLPGQVRGISPVDALKQSVGGEIAARKWSGQFFKNGATLGGIISVPGGPDTVDAKGLSEQFEARHSGEGKWWKPAVLTGGATFDSMTPTPKEAELGPLYQQAVEVAARFFHIPPHLLASQMAGAVSYASVEQRSIEYVQHGVVPITTRIERVLSRLLPGDRYVKLNVTSLLRGDATARAEFYRTLAELKVMTPKQIAALEDLPVDLATDGFHETPNNNGIPDRSAPAEPARGLGLSLDARVDDVALSVLADTQRDIVEQNTQRLAEQAARDREASRIEREAQRREIAELRAAFVEATRPAPAPVIDIRRDEHGRAQEVYERRGDEVIRKVITHDEDGRIVGVRVA